MKQKIYKNNKSESLLTPRQVKQQLGLRTKTSHTLRLLEKRGLLFPIRFNQRVLRYDPKDVERFIENSRVE